MSLWFRVQATDLTFKDTNGNTLKHDADLNSVKFNSDTLATYSTDHEAIDALNGIMRNIGVIELP
jgi:hypothetical protein